MASIIPVNEDRENLEEFAKAFCQLHFNTIIGSTINASEDNNNNDNNVIDAYENKLSDNERAIRNLLAFTSDEVNLLSQTCATVLAITAHTTRFFTAGSAQESAANTTLPSTLEGIANINNNITIRYHNNSSEADKSANTSSGIASKGEEESIKIETASPSPAGVNQEELEQQQLVKVGEVQSTLNCNTKLFQGTITPFDFLSSSSSFPANVALTQNEKVKQSVENHKSSIWHYGMKKLVTRHVPFQLLTSHVHEINELHLSLHNALEVLRKLNKRHAFIFTVNVMHIKAYVNALCKRRHLKLTPSERAQMHNASDDIIHDHSWKNESSSNNDNNYNESEGDNMEISLKNSHSFCYSTLSQNNSINNNKNNKNNTLIQNTNTIDKTGKEMVQEMTNSTNNINRNVHTEQEQTRLEQTPTAITADQTNSTVSVNQTHSDNHVESDLNHVDSQMLSILHKEEIPSFYVQQSYAVFIGWCQVLMEWTTQLLAIIYRSDGIPEPGTFILPPSPAETAIALPSSLTTLMNVAKKQSTKNTTTSSNYHNDSTTAVNYNTAQHRSRVVSVQRYQTYNVQQFYDLLIEQSQRTLDLKSTSYDAELQLMCISPSCIDTLKDVINECSMYITRLEDVEAGRLSADFIDPYFFPYEAYGYNTSVSADSYSAAHSNSTSLDNNDYGSVNNYLSHCKVVFIPSLSSFRLLRAMLRLYLSVSINAQEQTAVHLFEQRYRDVSSEAREMTRHLSSLPIPPKIRAMEQFEDDNKHKAHAIKEVVYANKLNKHNELQQQGEGQVSELEQYKRKTWEPTTSERKQLNEYFEQYWTIRDKVHALMCELRNDIKCKNKTHCVRVMGRCVINEHDEFAQKAEKWYQRHQAELNGSKNNNNNNNNSSFSLSSSSWLWRKVCDVGSALVSTITCQAEVYPTDMYDNRIKKNSNNMYGDNNNMNTNSISSGKVDDMSMPLSLYSPQYALKEMLYVDVKQLWQAIEVQGAQLEKIYIGRFHRSEKDKWLHYAEQCMRQVNKVSVVFDA